MVFSANGTASRISSGSSSFAKLDVPSDSALPRVLIGHRLDRAAAQGERQDAQAPGRDAASVAHRPPGQPVSKPVPAALPARRTQVLKPSESTLHYTSRTARGTNSRPCPSDGVLPLNRTRLSTDGSLTITPVGLHLARPGSAAQHDPRVRPRRELQVHRRLHRVQHPVADGAGREERVGEDGAAQGAVPRQPDPAGRRQLPRHRVPPAPVGGLPSAPAFGARPGRHRHVAPRGGRPGRRDRPAGPRRASRLHRRRHARLRQPAAVADRRRRTPRRLEPGAPGQARRGRAAQPVVRRRPSPSSSRRSGPSRRPRPPRRRCSLDVEERLSRRPARRAGGGDAREAAAAVPLLRRVPPPARRSGHRRADAPEGGEPAHRRRHDLPGAARAGQHDARGPAADRPVRVPRRRARVGVPAHHPRRAGVLEPGPVAGGRFPLRRRAARTTRRRSTPATSCARASATGATG